MLTDAQVRGLHGSRLADSQGPYKGLYIIRLPSGVKSWRFDFRFPRTAQGKRQTMVYGIYPEITLSEARERHLEARRTLGRGENPALLKKRAKQELAQRGADSFKAVAESWFQSLEGQRSASWQDNARRWLEKRIYPAFGTLALNDVRPVDVLGLLQQIKAEDKPNSAEAVRQLVAQVFDYGILHLRVDKGMNPARSLRGAVVVPKSINNPWLKRAEIPAFLSAVEGFEGAKALKLAARLLAHVFTRKLELIEAKWSEIDLEGAEWRIPGERMKNGLEHVVPLSRQAVAIFRDLKALAGESDFVFPSPQASKKPLAHLTLNTAFNRIGYQNKLTPHGLRATASTILNEQGWRREVIEAQLAHVERDQVRASYNHGEYLSERRRMLQGWSDYLDSLSRGGENVIPLKAA